METILNQSDIGSNLSEYIFWSFIIVLCGSWLHCPLVPLTRNVSCLLIFFLIIIMLLFPFAIAFTPNLSASSLIFSSFPLRVGFSHVWNLPSYAWLWCSEILGFWWKSGDYGFHLIRKPVNFVEDLYQICLISNGQQNS